MAKVRKTRLSWKPSESDQVISYRLYWSKGNRVDFDSNFIELGNVSELCLPDVLKLDRRYPVRIFLGITAVDKNGNESDMTTLAAPYQTIAPPAPADPALTILDEFSVIAADDDALRHFDTLIEEGPRRTTVEEEETQVESHPTEAVATIKHNNL